MIKKSFFFLILIVPYITFSQDLEKTLGYGCGYSGEPTPPVNRISELLVNKDYKSIKELLYSKNPVSNFLSAIIVQKLESDKKISLSEFDKKQINNLKQSKITLEICGGCTFHDQKTLSTLLNSKKEVFEANEFFFSGEYIKLEK